MILMDVDVEELIAYLKKLGMSDESILELRQWLVSKKVG